MLNGVLWPLLGTYISRFIGLSNLRRICGKMVMKRQMCHIYNEKWAEKIFLAAILNFWFQPIFFHMACLYTSQYSYAMKKIGPTLWLPWCSKGKILNFSDILSPISTPTPHFKRIRQHLQLVERKREIQWNANDHGVMSIKVLAICLKT
jgi:hypothetical protein